MNEEGQNLEKLRFSLQQFKQKDNLKHTFLLLNENSYKYIPIFKQDEKIEFRNQFYKIIKLKRRTETYLEYKIQNLDTNQVFTMEYQYIFDDKQNDENYEYYQDQTRHSSNESQLYRQFCRIALKKGNNENDYQLIQLTRYIHINNLDEKTKIKLLHTFANDNQIEQFDYNQIFIDKKWQISRQKNQYNQVSCFVQAPTSISPIINYKQTFLIGFYYAILNNLVIFNQYINKENNIKQALQNRFIDPYYQLQQQIKGAINYSYKHQIPKKFLYQGIKKTFDQYQIAEKNLQIQLVELILIILRIYQSRKNKNDRVSSEEKGKLGGEEIYINNKEKTQNAEVQIWKNNIPKPNKTQDFIQNKYIESKPDNNIEGDKLRNDPLQNFQKEIDLQQICLLKEKINEKFIIYTIYLTDPKVQNYKNIYEIQIKILLIVQNNLLKIYIIKQLKKVNAPVTKTIKYFKQQVKNSSFLD